MTEQELWAHYNVLKKKIDEAVSNRLAHYVYRLIDPRSGETFYVGKGKATRVLDHVLAAFSQAGADALDDVNEGRNADTKEDALDLKLDRIKQIHAAGLTVIHVIHRHGITTANNALLVEAALIDAYPGISNKQGGHGSGDYGPRNLQEIIAEAQLKPFNVDPQDRFILINIGRSFDNEKSIYENTRYAWRASLKRAKRYNLVVSHSSGVVRGVFSVEAWYPATTENFPLEHDLPGRIGFAGAPADAQPQERFLNKRVPDTYRQRGAANPFRYVN